MASQVLLPAAARAFALVSLSDGRLSPAEAARFAAFARADPQLASAAGTDAEEAFTSAASEVAASADFEEILPGIVAAAFDEADRGTLMRAAQAALVADGRSEDQENAAVAALAEALRLDAQAH